MKIDILSNLIEALEQEELKNIVELGSPAADQYRSLIKAQNEALKSLDTAEEGDDFIPKKEDLDFLIEELLVEFNTKRSKYKAELKRTEQTKNKQGKEDIIEKFRDLISNEENIGKAFITFNKLQEDWNAVGDVPSDDYHRIQSEYSRLRESFFYNIKIYKELADHDKKKNLAQKEGIIAEVRALNTEKSLKKQNTRIRELIKQWDNIGITFEDNWNSLREEFWTNAKSILNRVDKHYEGLREKAKEKLVVKKQLIEKAKEVTAFVHKSSGHWKKSTDKIIEIQNQWKKVGHSDKNEEIWAKFREVSDNFFSEKRKFFDSLRVDNLEVEEKKKDLIKQAEILKDSEDWKDSSKAMILLQKKWKEAGSTNPKKENALWKVFRSHQDAFFQNKSAFFAGKEDREKESLAKKEALINEIKAFKPSGEIKDDLKNLKSYAESWQNLGYVPFAKKESIYKAYKAALDGQYSALGINSAEKSKLRFEAKIESLKKHKDPEKAIDYERRKIRKEIETIKSNILQTENNLGFFNVSSGDSSMLDNINKKLKREKEKIEDLKSKLVQLRNA